MTRTLPIRPTPALGARQRPSPVALLRSLLLAATMCTAATAADPSSHVPATSRAVAVADAPGVGRCRVLIVSGDPGRPVVHTDATLGDYASLFDRWRSAWREQFVTGHHVPADQVATLRSPDPSDPAASVADAEQATHAHVVAALSGLAHASGPQDQVVLVLIGHGYHSGTTARFCLSDTDLSDGDIHDAFAGMRCKSCIVLAFAPDLRDLDRTCAEPGRVFILANMRTSAPYFCEFLLRQLTPHRALLDAFNAASLACISWYQHQWYSKKDKAWTVDGKENQELWRLFYPRGPMVAGADVAGPVDETNDPGQVFRIERRRVIAEVAGLDDNGDGTVSTVYEAGPMPTPLHPSAENPTVDGAFAAHLILGEP